MADDWGLLENYGEWETGRLLTVPESEAIANMAWHFIIEEFKNWEWPNPPQITPGIVRHVLFATSKVLGMDDLIAVYQYNSTAEKTSNPLVTVGTLDLQFYKTRYYPVDVTNRIIYNDPQKREMDCSFNSSKRYKELGTIGIRGEYLNRFPCYRSFGVR